ncbi:MAG TPA: MFS transporter [Alphaproteobacteria bacterium]|nr:MFS transporter [Alphaproteobacteria bacterium]
MHEVKAGLVPLYVWAVVVATAVQALGALGHLALPVLAGEAARDFGVDPGLIGVYSGIVFAGSAVSSLALAGSVPRIGVVRVSQLALICSSLGLALLALGEAWLLPISALLVGAGYGPMTPSSSFLLARMVPARMMSLVMSIKQTGVPIGYGLAGLLLPAVAIVSDWQTAILTAAGMAVALAVALVPVRRRLDAVRGKGQPFRWRSVLAPLALVARVPGLRRMAICSLAFSAVQIGIASFMVVYLDSVVGMGLPEAGSILAIANACAIGGRILWGGVADRIAARWVLGGLAFGMAAGVAALMAVTIEWPYVLIIAVGVVIGGTVISWNGVFLAETARQAPEGEVSEAMGGVLFVTFTGSVIGPPALTALLTVTGSYMVGFGLLVCVALAMAAMFFFAQPDSHQDEA